MTTAAFKLFTDTLSMHTTYVLFTYFTFLVISHELHSTHKELAWLFVSLILSAGVYMQAYLSIFLSIHHPLSVPTYT